METTIQLRSGEVLLRDIRKLPPPAPNGRGWLHRDPGAVGGEDYYPLHRVRRTLRETGVAQVRRGNVRVWPPRPPR